MEARVDHERLKVLKKLINASREVVSAPKNEKEALLILVPVEDLEDLVSLVEELESERELLAKESKRLREINGI